MCISIILTYISLAPGPVKMTLVSTGLRAWLNGKAGNVIRTFTEKKTTTTKRVLFIFVTSKLNVSHSTSFSIIKQVITMIHTKTFDKTVLRHCDVVLQTLCFSYSNHVLF